MVGALGRGMVKGFIRREKVSAVLSGKLAGGFKNNFGVTRYFDPAPYRANDPLAIN